MAGMQKHKGASFERKVCQLLSYWVTGGLRDDVFWRSAMSGGRSTILTRKHRKASATTQAGDITAIHESGHFLLSKVMFECKHYRDFKLHLLFWNPKACIVTKFWDKLVAQAAEHKRIPVLVIKQNNQNELLITNDRGVRFFELGEKSPGTFRAVGVMPSLGLSIYQFRDLLRLIDHDKIRAERTRKNEEKSRARTIRRRLASD